MIKEALELYFAAVSRAHIEAVTARCADAWFGDADVTVRGG